MREKLSRTEEELKEISSRWKWVLYLVMGAGLLLTGRLWYLQILHGNNLRQSSERNRLKQIKIPAPRGLIFDRNHEVLVDNLPGLSLSIQPQYVRDLKKTAASLSTIIGVPSATIIEKVRQNEKQYGSFRPVTIKRHLSLEETVHLKLLMWRHTGVDIQKTIIRNYPLKDNGAQLFGYVGEISSSEIRSLNKKYEKNISPFRAGDKVGKSGLEASWETFLRGKDGVSFVEVDVHNRKSRSRIAGLWRLKPQKPVPGQNLLLTLDKGLQQKTYEAFLRKDTLGTRKGSAVVMKTNGEILALVSYPSYNPNIFSKKIPPSQWRQLSESDTQPLRNKVIQDHHPPGSIFKPVVALAALQENIINPTTKINSPSSMVFRGRTYHDHRQKGYGSIPLSSALELSANVFFYQMGIQLGIDRMARYARMMNLGKKTQIKLKGESQGLVPDSQWKQKVKKQAWYPGENLSHAIGQGFLLVTPLQMAVLYNTIATAGKIVKPFVVKSIINTQNQSVKNFKPQVLKHMGDLISPQHFQLIQKALTQVVEGPQGTARWWKVKGIKVAGKTGTAQLMSFDKEDIYEKCKNRPLKQRHHGWFVAFAPAENPEITVAVLTEHSCAGGSGSAPLVRDIMQFYFDNKDSSAASHPGTTEARGINLPHSHQNHTGKPG